MTAAALLLADARFPAGGHAHSGGLEPAATAGTVTDIRTLELFLRGRLRTAGLMTAAIAAAACARAVSDPWPEPDPWPELDAEADARIPSPAQRDASRRQGRALLRAARRAWPDWSRWPPRGTAQPGASQPGASQPGAAQPGAPHHPVVIGAATAAARGTPEDAAANAAYQSIAGASSAAVRLLALDPMAAAAVLARLAPEADEVAEQAAWHAHGPLADLPFPSAPALDLLAEAHVTAEVRLFES
ncbi:MAG TPA: urease accessory UreF family protein [Trebonia sp.]